MASGGLVAVSCIPDQDKEKVQLSKPWFLRSGRGYESLNNGSENSARTRSLIHYDFKPSAGGKAVRSPSPAEDFTVKLLRLPAYKAVRSLRRSYSF